MYEQIARNKRRTVFLIVGTLVVVGALGYLFGWLLGTGPVGLVVALLIAGAMSFYSYRYGHRLVLRAARARPVTHDEEPRLHNIVESMAIAAGLPKPSVANVYDVQKVVRTDFLERVGHLAAADLAALDDGLRLVLAL